MKKIISYFALFLAWISYFSPIVWATTTTVSWTNVFQNSSTQSNKIIYNCGWKDCSLESWINDAKGQVDVIKSDWTAVSYVQEIVMYVLGFLFLVTVLIIIWAWVRILTSAGNDDVVQKSKKIIINAIIWLIVIFLAYPIASFVVNLFDRS